MSTCGGKYCRPRRSVSRGQRQCVWVNAEISTRIRLRGLSQVMSSGKPRAPGPAQKCLFGSQQYLAQGKDVITGERDENRRTRAPGVSIEGSIPAGEAAPEGEGKQESVGCWKPGGGQLHLHQFCCDFRGPWGFDTMLLHAKLLCSHWQPTSAPAGEQTPRLHLLLASSHPPSISLGRE